MTAYAPEPRWRYVHQVTLPVFEDTPGGEDTIYAPPGRVLNVSVVGERVFLTIATLTEDNRIQTMTKVEEECVSAEALLLALVHQMGVEFVQGLLRKVTTDA